MKQVLVKSQIAPSEFGISQNISVLLSMHFPRSITYANFVRFSGSFGVSYEHRASVSGGSNAWIIMTRFSESGANRYSRSREERKRQIEFGPRRIREASCGPIEIERVPVCTTTPLGLNRISRNLSRVFSVGPIFLSLFVHGMNCGSIGSVVTRATATVFGLDPP